MADKKTPISDAEKALRMLRTQGRATAAWNRKTARSDLQAAYDRRDGIEEINGNRGNIGHSQYWTMENDYDRQTEGLNRNETRLEASLARQLRDLEAEKTRRDADGSLSGERERLRQAYAEGVRADENQRRDYEYAWEQARLDEQLRRQEEAEVRDAADRDRSWLQSLGQQFLRKGVMPSEDMLEAMDLSRESARMYVSAVRARAVSAGGSGSSGSSGSGSTKTTKTAAAAQSAPAPAAQKTQGGWGTVSGYNSKVAGQVFELAKNGDYYAGKRLLEENKKLFSEKNAALILTTAWRYYRQSGSTLQDAAATQGGGPSRTYELIQ